MQPENKFEEWCVLELFGHQRLAGKVTEAQIGGASFVRIDVPDVPATQAREYVSARPAIPGFTKFYGPGAIYAMSPTTEEVARAVAAQIHAVPIDAFDITSIVKQMAAANVAKLPARVGGDDEFYPEGS